ncbi:MAG TPA: hypothetical protein VIY29_13530 [Ktedonobacteraceae bacterium]
MDASVSVQSGIVKSDLDGGKLSEEDLYRHDPLLVLLRQKFHLNTVTGTIVIAICALILTASVLFGFAELVTPGSFDLGPHFGATLRALLQTIIFPVLAALYLTLPFSIANLFNTFKANGVIGSALHPDTEPKTYESFLRRMISWLDSLWWSVAALGIVVLFWFYRLLIIVPQSEQLLKDHSLASWRFWLQVAILVIYSPLLYCAFLTVVRLLITLAYSSWLFHLFTIKVNPLHPDGYAGLGVLGSMLSISTILMVTLGIAALVMNSSFLLGNTNIYSQVEAIVLGIGYVALAPTLLISWLILPHNVLQGAHDDALRQVADQFPTALASVNVTASEDANAIKAGTDRLSELKRRYDFIDQTYPTWPVEIRNVRRLVATISIPALIPILIPLLTTAFVYLSRLFGSH